MKFAGLLVLAALAGCASAPVEQPRPVAAAPQNPPAEIGAQQPPEALPEGINPITREVEQRALAQ